MEYPNAVKRFYASLTNVKERLWLKSKLENNTPESDSKLNVFVRIAAFVSVLAIVVCVFLALREYWIGDYPIYGTNRIGAICDDGWHSHSTGRGTCSHHGGVHHWLFPLIDYHYCNPEPYFITIVSSFALLILLNFFSRSYRLFFIAVFFELIFLIVRVLIFIVLLVLYYPFKGAAHLLKG